MKYRITEVIDSNGKSVFYPERKVLGLWWWQYEAETYGPDTSRISFRNYKDAEHWLCYKRCVKVKIHSVRCCGVEE